MKKIDLIEALAEKTGDSKAAAARAIDGLIEVASERLAAGEDVTLPGFGKFSTHWRMPRTVQHPMTGAPLRIKGRMAVRFSPGKALRDDLGQR